MTDLPSTWCATSVEAISYPLRYGYTASADPEADGPKFLRITDIQNGRVAWSGVPRCEIEEDKRADFLLSSGDIVFARTGGTVGKSFLIREVPEEAVFASYLIKVSPAQGIEPRYLYWFFQSLNYWEQIALKKGGLQGNVNATTLGSIELALSPTNEQRRIVEKIEAMFDEIDKGVESLQTARTTLGLYRQSLLKSAFEGRLTADWRAQNTDKLEAPETLLTRIQKERNARYKAALDDWQQALAQWRADGEKGKKPAKPKRPADLASVTHEELTLLPEIPPEWGYTKLANVGDLGRGKSKHRPRNDKRLFGGQYPFIQTGEVKAAGRYITEHEATYSDFGLEQSKLWPAGTLCITIAANIAETAFLTFDACFPDSVVGFATFEKIITPKFVELFIKSARVNIEAYAPATAQKNINLNTLETLVIPLCGQAEQTEIVRILDARLEAADRLEAEIDAALTRANALRQSVLKKAFSGKLVPQDPADEPASALLARIKTERDKAPKTRRRRVEA